VQLRVSPIAEAVAGLCFGRRCLFTHDGGPDAASADMVHHTGHDLAPVVRRAPCVVVPAGRSGRREQHRREPQRLVRPAPSPLARPRRPAFARAVPDHVPALLQQDLVYRAQRLVSGGIAAVFDDLHPRVSLRGGVLTVRTRCTTESVVAANSLTLTPSAYSDRVVLFPTVPGQAPLLIYPALGADPGPNPAEQALGGLLDDQVLPLLHDLREPRTVDELAHRHRIPSVRAREQVEWLTAAGLLTVSDSGYRGTALASLLTSPVCSSCR
jgi:hypothetical protein